VWKEKTDSPGVGYPEVITLPEPRIGNDESASVFKCFPLMLPYNAHTAELASSLLFSLIRNDERPCRDETSRPLAMVGLRHVGTMSIAAKSLSHKPRDGCTL
jgi:hypothetical protein